MEQAAALARLDKDLRDFPNGYDTLVGERGITLSGGQKQRTSLARALVTDPEVLILDDALSAVDTYTEDEILHRLREVRRGRTCLIVSHRVSTVRDADLIVVLDDGRIAERGTHDAPGQPARHLCRPAPPATARGRTELALATDAEEARQIATSAKKHRICVNLRNLRMNVVRVIQANPRNQTCKTTT